MIQQHDIGGAVDQVEAIRNTVISSAGHLVDSADPKMIAMLGESLVIMAKILATFHQVFDCPVDPRSLSEDERELQDWAAEYDRSYADSLVVYRKYSAVIPQN